MVKTKAMPWFPIVATVAIALIPFYFWKPTKFIFAPLSGGFTIYETGFGIILLLGFLKSSNFLQWFNREISFDKFKKSSINVLSNFGLRWDRREVLAGLIVGVATGLAGWTVGTEGLWINTGLVSLAVLEAITMVFLAPLYEETLFRGYLINKILDSIKSETKGKTLAILGSVLIFSWMHVHSPWNKLLPAVVFTTVYLWRWKRNLTAAIITHATANVVIISMAFSHLGLFWILGVLALSGLMLTLLIVFLKELELG